MAFILPETDCHFLAFFFFVFFVFSPCSGRRAASYRPLYSTEQQRGEESSWVHLQKGCRWAWKTCSVLCVCSCLALHTSAKLGSSIRSVAWACWREMDWERERERERVGDRGVLVLSLWFSVTSLALSFFLRLLPSSLFPRLKQGSESKFFLGASMSLNHPRVHRSAGLRDAVTLPWNNVSIQSKNSVETEKSPKSNYCAYY